jgi:hypothetical protein
MNIITFVSIFTDEYDWKTSMSLSIIFTMNKPQHISEHPVVFITTFLYLSLRTPDLPHSDLQSKFHCSITSKWLSEFLTISWTRFIPNTIYFLNFAITNSLPSILSFFFRPEIVTDYRYRNLEWKGGAKRNFPKNI